MLYGIGVWKMDVEFLIDVYAKRPSPGGNKNPTPSLPLSTTPHLLALVNISLSTNLPQMKATVLVESYDFISFSHYGYILHGVLQDIPGFIIKIVYYLGIVVLHTFYFLMCRNNFISISTFHSDSQI